MSIRTLSPLPLPIQRPVANSRSYLGSTAGWAASSNPSKVRTRGNLGVDRPIWMRRWCLTLPMILNHLNIA